LNQTPRAVLDVPQNPTPSKVAEDVDPVTVVAVVPSTVA
jgi:hypothetical protein